MRTQAGDRSAEGTPGFKISLTIPVPRNTKWQAASSTFEETGKPNSMVLGTSGTVGVEGKLGERRLKTGASVQRRNWKADLSPTVNILPFRDRQLSPPADRANEVWEPRSRLL